MRRGFLFAVLALTWASCPAAEPVTFERHARAVFKAYCHDCHGAGEKMPGGLDLRLRRFAVAGGTSGPAVVPGDPGKSLLLQRIKAGEMPPGEKKVPPEQVAVLEAWIAGGALARSDEPATLPPGLGITAEERAYWFYQPLHRPDAPTFADERVRTPIDAFVLAKLRAKGLGFNPDADRATLIRRATFDLTGLPPTPADIGAFVADPSPDAYEKMLDRLLASPAYGERWGRHWLDAAGYADSDGDGATDTVRPHAWRYRDTVVRALNADKPLDRFIVEQVAGDELVPRPWTNLTPEAIDLLAATGFLRTAPDGTASGGKPEDIEQAVADALKVVTACLLGTSVACAQCHDHRYDPVPQADYFRLRAVFEPALDPAKWRRPTERLVSLYTDAQRAKASAVEAEATTMQAEYNQKQSAAVRAAYEKELEKFPAGDRPKLKAAFDTSADKRTDEQKALVAANPKLNVSAGVLYQYNAKAAEALQALQAKVQAKRAERPAEEFVAVTAEVPGRVPVTKLHHRGNARQPKGPDLAPADLTIAAPDGERFEIAPGANPSTTGRRLAWATHLTSGTHPLFGRVMANRVWLNHFGRGIVDTPGEFGKLGQPPTHPELLDWLATELPRQGWSLKALHRLVMTSTVYRQSSQRDPATDAVDPANALYGRFPVRRLEAEAVRDRALVAAGRLDRTPFGPPVAGVEDAAGQVGTPDAQPRRSVYLQVRRSKPVALLAAFDAPAGELSCERRNCTTSAPQSLMLLNGDFLRAQAAHLAARALGEATAEVTAEALAETPFARAAVKAWQFTYLRPPSADELGLATDFLVRQSAALRGKAKDADLAALTNLCQQLLASNEFLYVD